MTATLVLLGALAALLAGLAAGRAWERRRARRRRQLDRRSERGSPHYLLGLDHLVSKQIDLAIEAFTKAARLDSDALEIHLILGNLYRESGHVSKAIQIHQRLLQRPHMTTLERAHVLLCLGRDYKHGGFIDRAAETFSEVARLDPRNTHALLNLEKLHEEQHEWREARVIRQRMAEAAGDEDNPRDQAILAFLESELGLQAMREQRPEQAIRHFEAGDRARLEDRAGLPAPGRRAPCHRRNPAGHHGMGEDHADCARARVPRPAAAPGGLRHQRRPGALPRPVPAVDRHEPAGLARATGAGTNTWRPTAIRRVASTCYSSRWCTIRTDSPSTRRSGVRCQAWSSGRRWSRATSI